MEAVERAVVVPTPATVFILWGAPASGKTRWAGSMNMTEVFTQEGVCQFYAEGALMAFSTTKRSYENVLLDASYAFKSVWALGLTYTLLHFSPELEEPIVIEASRFLPLYGFR